MISIRIYIHELELEPGRVARREWAKVVQSKLSLVNIAPLSKIHVFANWIDAKIDIASDKYEILCDSIHDAIGKDCSILLYRVPDDMVYRDKDYFELLKAGGRGQTYLSADDEKGEYQSLFAKGYPELNCGVVIEKEYCNAKTSTVSVKYLFTALIDCSSFEIQEFEKGWKISYYTDCIDYRDFVRLVCNYLDIKYFHCYLDCNDNEYKTLLAYEVTAIPVRERSFDDERTIISAIDNGNGDMFGY